MAVTGGRAKHKKVPLTRATVKKMSSGRFDPFCLSITRVMTTTRMQIAKNNTLLTDSDSLHGKMPDNSAAAATTTIRNAAINGALKLDDTLHFEMLAWE